MEITASAGPHARRGDPSTARLKPDALGVLGVLFLVLSAQAPLTGIAGAAPISVAIGDGPGVPASYAAAGLVILLFSVGFVAMGRHVVGAGAFYVYIGRGLGRMAGTGSAGVALFSYCTIQAAMYGLLGATVHGLAGQHLGVDLPWWAWALVAMAVVQVLGVAGIEMGARVLAVFVIAEFGILLVFGLITLVKGGGPEGLGFAESFSPSAALQGSPGIAIMLSVASMFGFEATAIYGEEARTPHKTVPRATYTAVLLVTGFFAFISWMVISAHGASKAVTQAGAALQSGDSSGFVFGPVTAQLGAWAATVLPILLATSLFAGVLAFHNSANRYLFSLGREGLLPGVLRRLNTRHAPWAASVAQTVIALVLVLPFAILGKDPVLALFSWFSGVAVLAMMLLYLLTSVSVVVFFRRERLDTRPWNTLIAPVLAVLGLFGAICVILANFTTLIGGDEATAGWLVATVPAVLVLAAVGGLIRKPMVV